MRIEPPPNTSLGGALIRLRCPFAVDEVRITFIYRFEEHLRRDYNRSVRAKRFNGAASTRTHTLRLERSKRGEYWFDFGLRHYLKQSGSSTSKRRFVEKPGHRIAVPVVSLLTPSLDRQEVLAEVAASNELIVVFSLWDVSDDPDFSKTQDRHLQAAIGPHPGTRAIYLGGMESLGQLVLTKKGRQQGQSWRRDLAPLDGDQCGDPAESQSETRTRFLIPLPKVRCF
jgi:hypothetical protein